MTIKTLQRAWALALGSVGLALLVWVGYDAGSVLNALGSNTGVDEATIAALGLSLGVFLVVAGLFTWHTAEPVQRMKVSH